MTDHGFIAKENERYLRAGHRIQTAIAAMPERRDSTPKHLRVGIDMSKSDMGGLAKLLIDKGVFTLEEYVTAIADQAEIEANTYEDELSSKFGRNISTI